MFIKNINLKSLSQWPRGLRAESAEARLLRLQREHGCLSVVSVVCYQVEWSLCRVDHSSRGFLQNVVCLSVIVKLTEGS